MMIKDDLGRSFLLDVCANGSVHIRERGKEIESGLLPVYSTNTRAEAEALQVRHCRLASDGSGYYFLTHPPTCVEDLGRISDLFRASHQPEKIIASAEATAPVANDSTDVRVNDLREGLGTHHPRVRVMSIDADMGDAVCVLVRSGNRKTIRVVTLSKTYRLIERDYGPAKASAS